MKVQPWISFNLFLLCIAFGIFQLQTVSIPNANKNDNINTTEYSVLNDFLRGIIYIDQSRKDFSTDLKKINLVNNSGSNLSLQIKASNSGMGLFADEKLIIDDIIWAKFELDELSGIPFIVMNMRSTKQTIRANLNFPLLGRANG